ncbi:hypothetical protein AVEN_131221-1 [Araneus ventricosus]|uniref:Uncharacterized protein n=1 Tax=Araneus ventricosus TaxID=182803 RepID=A0A4Y2R8S9_ARAVE|nr:hypothetical protein AVEN_253231-1 [Araneus ventricosus]GBN72174.1 hypothetical protein AVEN_131221-1 [Araneus ventricosus]
MNQIKNISGIFYNPSSILDAISQAGEKMFLAGYKAPTNEHNHRYAAFLKSSTKIKSDLSSIPPTKGEAEQHLFSNAFLFLAPAMISVLLVPL